MEGLERVEILLVEDNPHDAELAIRALKKKNLTNNLVWVKDGAEALYFIFYRGKYINRPNKMPRLILLDLKLPKVDGLEVLRQIKEDNNKKVIPVVVLTSSKEDRDMVESYKLGVNSYLVKPMDFEKFVESVSELGLYWLLLNQSLT